MTPQYQIEDKEAPPAVDRGGSDKQPASRIVVPDSSEAHDAPPTPEAARALVVMFR